MLINDVQAFLRTIPDDRRLRVGPFTAKIDPDDPDLPFNHAVPDDGADPTPDDVAALIAAFHARARVPRLEYVPRAAPKVEAALLAAGLTPEGRYPLLVCPPSDVLDVPLDPDIQVSLVPASATDDLWSVARITNAAFDAPPPADHDLTRMLRLLAEDGLIAAARDTTTGAIVGAGQLLPPRAGVAEVAGIATAPTHRRRGIAGAVTAALTRAGAQAGITTLFLTPADDQAARVYARVGYHKQAEALFISLPA
ncbi:GNAT family N-acetyltransferase [Actinomadura rupiterrae]|uniref:GNAT family N-acetyltransferase n=1 Tax=Actinomadura rupiterrae TaxID=559627 RepID=UPI0027E3908D|nr:GNAT family N-acetyltransferase [Actinomadura rupiterrae]MCP2340016.1 ribosomal protein S18 acetylase RimI-like enzyme [Actinomadura rupiterrae]